MLSAPVPLPAYFGADPKAEVFFHPYTNGGMSIRTQVMLTHHLLSLVQEGEKEVLVASKRERMDASRLVLLAATAGIMSEHGLHGRPMRSMLLFFSPAFLVEFCARHSIKPGKRSTELLALPQDDYTRHFARSIELLGCDQLNGSAALCRTKAEEILLCLSTRHVDAVADLLSTSLKDRDTLSLRFIVAQHQDSNLSVSELAFLCHMSVSTFKRRFQEAYAMPPGKYLHERRMQRAKSMLECKQRPSDIYHTLGYESLSAFSTEFKKHFGVTPTSVEAQVGPSA